jgi:hypothetical protein
VKEVGPSGGEVQGVGLRRLAVWDYGLESRRGHGCLSRVSVVLRRVERSLRRADHSSRGVLLSVVCVTGYVLVISKMRRLRATSAVEP